MLIIGFWVCDKAGKMRALKSGMPQLDPCCFPVLHPRGTLGWRFFMKKNEPQCKGVDNGENEMQEELDRTNQQEVEDMIDGEGNMGEMEDETEEADGEPIDEEENELDSDEVTCDNGDESASEEREESPNPEGQLVHNMIFSQIIKCIL